MRRSHQGLGVLWVAGVGVVVLGTGCATLSPAEPDSQAIEELQRRVTELQKKAVVNEVELARLREQVARLEARLPERASVQAPREVAPAPPREDAEAVEVPARLPVDVTELEPDPEAGPVTHRGPPPEVPAPASPAAPPAPVDAEAQRLYDAGYTLFHQQRYRDAETRFARFLELYPHSDLADNAQFWIGESRYALGEFRGALEAFSATVERYPEGNKVPDAMLKAGKCLEALGDTPTATETYREIDRRFAGTAAAISARERLAELDAATDAPP